MRTPGPAHAFPRRGIDREPRAVGQQHPAERQRHVLVRNAGLEVFAAMRIEAVGAVERHRVRLRREHDAGVPLAQRRLQQRREHRAAQALSAALLEHRHAPDMAVGQQAPGGDDHARVPGQRVKARGVLVVELDVARHALLLDEHGEADRLGVRARLAPGEQFNPWHVQKYNSRMKSLWSDAEAAQFAGPLGPRVYTSRLLGRDKSLVLHGGGNTSVKIREKNLFGEDEEVLYVKGSGWDLETIEPAGFTPVKLDYLRRLASLPALSDPQMVNELATHTLRAGAPAPSVETILHAILPQRYVDHTHADAVLSISNSPDGDQRIRDAYGDKAVVIPYIMAGFDLAAYCAREFPKQKTKNTVGMVSSRLPKARASPTS